MSVRIRRTVYWDGEATNDYLLAGHFETVADARRINRYARYHLVPDGDADVYAYTIRAQGETYHIREVYTYENTEKENSND